MSLNSMDLGLAACRALMRDLDDKPVFLEVYNPNVAGRHTYETTSEGQRRGGLSLSRAVVLVATLDMVGVRANLAYEGFGMYEQAELSPEADEQKKPYAFFYYGDYPDGPTSAAFQGAVRAAVDKGLAAIEQHAEAAR
jgi:hypothetical protein